MKSYSMQSSFSNLKYSILNFFKTNQIRIIVIGVLSLLAIVTGVFTAVKFVEGSTTIVYSDFGLTEFASGNSGTTAMFFQRFISYSVILIVLSLCSLTTVLIPVGVVVIMYRGFLLGLNVTFVIVIYGVSGILTGILIILPAQLIMLALLILFFIIIRDKCIMKNKYGSSGGMNVFLLMLIFILILSIINLAETILLVITSAKVILII